MCSGPRVTNWVSASFIGGALVVRRGGRVAPCRLPGRPEIRVVREASAPDLLGRTPVSQRSPRSQRHRELQPCLAAGSRATMVQRWRGARIVGTAVGALPTIAGSLATSAQKRSVSSTRSSGRGVYAAYQHIGAGSSGFSWRAVGRRCRSTSPIPPACSLVGWSVVEGLRCSEVGGLSSATAASVCSASQRLWSAPR